MFVVGMIIGTVILILSIRFFATRLRNSEEHAAQMAECAALARRYPAATALGEFPQTHNDLQHAVEREYAQRAEEYDDETTAAGLIANAAGSILRLVVLQSDFFKPEDGEIFYVLSTKLDLLDSSVDLENVLAAIKQVPTDDPRKPLNLLAELQSQERAPLLTLLQSFAREIASTCPAKRQVAADAICLVLAETPKESDVVSEEKTKESYNEASEFLYGVLGVPSHCTDSELKYAYRTKLAQWHPDKHDSMAPELRQIATETTAALNHAYECLQATRSRSTT